MFAASTISVTSKASRTFPWNTWMARISALKNHGVKPEELEELWRQRAERIPMGWMGDAFDVARAVAFLASDDARFITGQTLVVDGGMTLGI